MNRLTSIPEMESTSGSVPELIGAWLLLPSIVVAEDMSQTRVGLGLNEATSLGLNDVTGSGNLNMSGLTEGEGMSSSVGEGRS